MSGTRACRRVRRVNTPQAITWAVVAALLFWSVGAYNRLVRLRGEVARQYGAVESQFRADVSLGCCLFQVAHILTQPAQSQQSAFFRQILQQLLQALARRPHQHGERERVEIADSIVVRQA